MKTKRSVNDLKILELFKSGNIELGIQLCKAVGLDVVDLLAIWFDDFDYNTGYIEIGNIRVMQGNRSENTTFGEIINLFWGQKGVPPAELGLRECYSTMYDDFTDYKELAVVVYKAYCESK